ncbi:hypothetical protein HN789_06540 [archaeon]|jgi:ERG8-type phosphomevalonate kinase|nr:hypothetical protein [archaeon]MBT4022778.1 hypothetical protein [archaeon]MBT4273028.1 hypothetical protein [archaeon]MBT4460881.1 hypothetical protein [archaeon]MBT4858097.1 hypothetical protein [archaeon]
METQIRTYGKLLIFGSYAILEPGNIGLVVNVNKGTTTKIEETREGQLVLDIKNFDISVSGTVQGHKINLKKEHDEVYYVKNAIEYSFKYLKNQGIKIKDVKITSINDPELFITRKLKTGFGSSATSTVGVVAAILELHGIENRKLVYKIARYAHYKSQGRIGSGFDISAACYGNHFFMAENHSMDTFEKYMESEQGLLKEVFYWPQNLIPIIIFTGNSASTTELVKKVFEYREKNPQEYKLLMQEYNFINIACKKAFELNNLELIRKQLEKSWEFRKLLGEKAKVDIESKKITRILEKLKKHGAFAAGLLGAGGGDSIIALCTNKLNRNTLIEYAQNSGLTVLDNVEIVNKGYEAI